MISDTIRRLAAASATRAVPSMVVEVQDKLEQLKPRLSTYLLIKREAALDQAMESESQGESSETNNPLVGLPSLVKNGLAVLGWLSCRGYIARLLEANGVFLGKTTLPDFSTLASGETSQHGVTRNPRNRRFNSGGSSSGATTAVAAQMMWRRLIPTLRIDGWHPIRGLALRRCPSAALIVCT